MKTITLCVVVLCTALPAAAQSRLYTNADLSSKPVTPTRTVTAAELAGLKAREFVWVPSVPAGPRVFVLPASERASFAPFPPRFDPDDLWRDPVTAFRIQHPIEAAYGLGITTASTAARAPGRRGSRAR